MSGPAPLDPARPEPLGWQRLLNWSGLLNRVLRNASWRLSANVLGILVSAATFPIVARLLGSEGYGQVGIVTGAAALVGQIVGVRLWEAVIKYLSEFLNQKDAGRAWALVRLAYLLDIGMALLVLVVVAIGAPWAAKTLLHDPGLAGLFVLAGLYSAAGMTSTVSTALLRVLDQFRFLSLADVVSAVLRSALLIGLVWAGWGVAGALIAYTVTLALWSAALLWQAVRLFRRQAAGPLWGPIIEPLRERLREIGRYVFNLSFDTYRKAITANADMVILGIVAPASTVGVYRVARQLAGYVGQLGNPLYEVMLPEFAREWQGPGRAQLVTLIKRLTVGIAIVFAVGLVLSAFVARPLILAVFGPEFAQAAPLFLILLLANVWFVWLWLPALLLTSGHEAALVKINLSNALVSLLLMVLLGVQFQGLGVAIGMAANPFVGLVPMAWLLYRRRREFGFQA